VLDTRSLLKDAPCEYGNEEVSEILDAIWKAAVGADSPPLFSVREELVGGLRSRASRLSPVLSQRIVALVEVLEPFILTDTA
jgi:hypothetical protein